MRGPFQGFTGYRGFAGYGTPREVSGRDIIGDEDMGALAAIKAAQYQGGEQGFNRGFENAMKALQGNAMAPALRTRFPGATSGEEVVRSDGGTMRRLVVPLPAGITVAAGATVITTIRPQRAFRMEKVTFFQIPGVPMPTTLNPLLILSINIGAEPVFVNSGAFPMEAFRADAVGNTLRGYTAFPGIDITLTVLNPSADSWSYAGGFIGEAIGADGV